MHYAASRRAREVSEAQSEYRMTMLLLIGCVLVVALFAGYMLQVTAASVSSHLAHMTDHDYQVTSGKLVP
jgi:multisubunit Na+/H+ antiporter MnhB subunit